MIKNIVDPINQDRIALVVVGYNRLYGLKRLLESLKRADYGEDNVPLVISIDCSGNKDVYTYASKFEWPHGCKYVNIEETRLGLREHIYKCGDLCNYFKAIALFEDDIWVSPYFFSYLKLTVENYGQNEHICEIALYRNERLGGSGFYFDILHDGSDYFLWQDICTWGQCWTSQMWNGFRTWLEKHDDEYIINNVDMPTEAKQWTRAWSKYYMAYEIDTHKYVLYPQISLTTNFNDGCGEHGGGDNWVQVNVLHGNRHFHFKDVGELVKYDIYNNNEQLLDWLPNMYHDQICLDLYGIRTTYREKRYVLSMKRLPYSIVEEWGIEMCPLELNVLYNIKGKGIRLYDTLKPAHCKISRYKLYTDPTMRFFTRGLNLFLLIGLVIDEIKDLIVRKIKIR